MLEVTLCPTFLLLRGKSWRVLNDPVNSFETELSRLQKNLAARRALGGKLLCVRGSGSCGMHVGLTHTKYTSRPLGDDRCRNATVNMDQPWFAFPTPPNPRKKGCRFVCHMF